MATYEVEHNLPSEPAPRTRPRRPDPSSFFSILQSIDTSGSARPHNNSHAVPIPDDISTAYSLLFQWMDRARQDGRNPNTDNNSLEGMFRQLMEEALNPPAEVRGVSEGFLADLERVPKRGLKPTDQCPICSNPFLEDDYPLVVRLPCHSSHMFDLECITPWLKLHTTCPLDRKDLLKKPEHATAPSEATDEDEWDEMYA